MSRSSSAGDSDPSDLASECREIARHFASPERLRDNSLAQTILRRAGVPSDPRRALHAALDDAISKLSARDRAIVERCDIEQSMHASVAADLGISERHLYRERRRIFAQLGTWMAEVTPSAVGRHSIDLMHHLIGSSRSLEENGSPSAAAEIIERLLIECTDPTQRSRLFLRLAELHARAGGFTRAEDSIAMAVEHASRGEGPREPIQAEILLTRAFAMEECGKGATEVAQFAAQASRLARSCGSFRFDQVAAGVLVRALALSAQAAAAAGDLEALRRSVAEMRSALALVRDPDSDTQIAALHAESMSKLFCEHDVEGGVDCMSRAVAAAHGAGFTLSATMLTINLASFYRLEGAPHETISMLGPRLAVARRLANPNVLLALLVELVNAFVDSEQYDRASEHLSEAGTLAGGNDVLHAAFLRTSANVHVATGSLGLAVEEARAAERAYAQLGKLRLVGAVRRLQAEALWLGGERRAALSAVRSAIEVLSSRNHRTALARAYATLAKISGSGAPLDEARRLGRLGP